MTTRLLLPLAVISAGIAIGIGLAVGGGKDTGSAGGAAPEPAQSARVEISSKDAAERFGTSASQRRVGGDFILGTSACRPSGKAADGRFRCILRFIGRDSAGPQRDPEVFEVTFRSSDDLEPAYSAQGLATAEDLRIVSAPSSEGLTFPGSQPCGSKAAAKGMSCDEQQSLADRIGPLDNGSLGVDEFRCAAVDGNTNVVSCTDGSREFRYFATD